MRKARSFRAHFRLVLQLLRLRGPSTPTVGIVRHRKVHAGCVPGPLLGHSASFLLMQPAGPLRSFLKEYNDFTDGVL